MRKTLRGIKIAAPFIEMAVRNAFVLYCQQQNAENKTSLQFREKVQQYLMNENQDTVYQTPRTKLTLLSCCCFLVVHVHNSFKFAKISPVFLFN